MPNLSRLPHLSLAFLLNLFIASALSSVFSPAFAQIGGGQVPPDLKYFKYFRKDKNTGATDTLPYRLLLPNGYNKGEKYPLLILLHGRGERGYDNEKQVNHFLDLMLLPQFQRKHKAVVIIPQCSERGTWSNYVKNQIDTIAEVNLKAQGFTVQLQMVQELAASIETEYNTDPNKRYISGLSMGGFGTLELLARYPRYYTAAVPICGGGDVSLAKEIAKTPVWIVHGDQDPTVPVRLSRNLISALKKQKGAEVIYSELPNVRHNAWKPTYSNPMVLDWLFSH